MMVCRAGKFSNESVDLSLNFYHYSLPRRQFFAQVADMPTKHQLKWKRMGR